MAYTPPSGSAVDFAFIGSSYTPPAGGAVNFAFFTGQQAQGFKPTQFGTATASLRLLATGDAPATQFGSARLITAVVSASGFQSTQLGEPNRYGWVKAIGVRDTQFGTPQNIPNAVGFRSTQHGTHLYHGHVTCAATSISPSVQVSTPVGWQHWNQWYSLNTTEFGTPTTPFNQTLEASSLLSTQFGEPSLLYLPTGNAECAPTGFKVTTFGTATTHTAVSVQGVGAEFPQSFGAPVGGYGLGTTGVTLTEFGTPTQVSKVVASSWLATQFGVGVFRRTQAEQGFAASVRFGTPFTVRSNTYRAYSINVSRKFGRAKGFSRHNHPASGLQNIVSFGAAGMKQKHYATMLPSYTRFGTGIVDRSIRC